ncbi:MAG TPA: acetylglutamate kinase [Microbacteriaceae bacterium]|nr:acetylglutamate kinase [Microbacteriaceae bacterium]
MTGDTQDVRAVTTPEAAAAKATVLVEALPWIRRFQGAVIVVKFGGNAMVDPDLARTFAEDMTFLRYAGLRPIVVHGGGPQISAALAAAGITSEFRGGYRVTSPEAIPVVRAALVEEVAAGLVARLDGLGRAMPGDVDGLLTGARRGAFVDGAEVDLGEVGEVTAVDASAIRAALDAGRIPVISTLARNAEGAVLNVNADAAAAAVAIALGAQKLVVLTDVAGLYADWPNRDSLISHLDSRRLRELLPGLESGMIPKMTACLDAVEGGVPKAAIIDGRQPHSVLLEIFTDQGVGTEVVLAETMREGAAS